MKRSSHLSLASGVTLVLLPFSAAFGDFNTGLLNYWTFEGNYNDSASSISNTASTVADTGTPTANVSLQAGGPLGQYASCAQGHISVLNSADILMAGKSLSISAWYKVTAFNTDWQALIAHGEDTDYRVARYSNNAVMSYAGGVGDIPSTNTGPAANDGQWHHIVTITEAGISTRLWVDGVLQATGGAPTLTNHGSAQLWIGGNPDATGRDWNGSIDDVAMWNRPLTVAEIGSIYTAGRAGSSLSTLIVNADTDHDGMPDVWESSHGLNPNSAEGDDGADGDPDHDGLTNIQEYTNAQQTHPNNPDTDGDGLTDGMEVKTTHTNPLVADTDGDGLTDGQEVNTYHSNPLAADSDGDGMTDGIEVATGTDPATPNTEFGFGLVAYWPMDDNFNSTVNSITATANGSTPVSLVPGGKFGKAVQLNGVDQFLQVDGDENKFDFVGQSMTLSAWFTADVIDKEWQCLVAKGDAAGNWRFHRRATDTPPELSFCGGSTDLPKHSVPLSVGTNFYHHVVGVSQLGVSVRLYIDGVLVSTGAAPAFTDSANPMKIGANPDTSPGRFWNGKVDDLGVWRRALTDAEISQLWNGGTGTAIGDLMGAPVLFQITQSSYDAASNSWSLTWNSKPGKTYSLNYSTDLVNFGFDVDDSIASGGATTSYGPFLNPSSSSPRLFFKITEN